MPYLLSTSQGRPRHANDIPKKVFVFCFYMLQDRDIKTSSSSFDSASSMANSGGSGRIKMERQSYPSPRQRQAEFEDEHTTEEIHIFEYILSENVQSYNFNLEMIGGLAVNSTCQPSPSLLYIVPPGFRNGDALPEDIEALSKGYQVVEISTLQRFFSGQGENPQQNPLDKFDSFWRILTSSGNLYLYTGNFEIDDDVVERSRIKAH